MPSLYRVYLPSHHRLPVRVGTPVLLLLLACPNPRRFARRPFTTSPPPLLHFLSSSLPLPLHSSHHSKPPFDIPIVWSPSYYFLAKQFITATCNQASAARCTTFPPHITTTNWRHASSYRGLVLAASTDISNGTNHYPGSISSNNRSWIAAHLQALERPNFIIATSTSTSTTGDFRVRHRIRSYQSRIHIHNEFSRTGWALGAQGGEARFGQDVVESQDGSPENRRHPKQTSFHACQADGHHVRGCQEEVCIVVALMNIYLVTLY